jgi:Mrp family chromosome partitioning ATPase
MLAAQADGVLFVIKSGSTKIGSAISAAQQLKRQGAQILGVVLNCTPEVR